MTDSRYFETEDGQKTIADLLHGDDLASTSEYLMGILFDRGKREHLFRQFLEFETDVSYDWFNLYYSQQMTLISKKSKSYYSPPALGKLAKQLVDVARADGDGGKNVNGPDKNCPVLPNAYGCHLNSRIIRSFISV